MMKSNLFFVLVIAITVISCSKLEEPDNVTPTDKIQIFSDKDTVIAKIDTIAISAKIPKEANISDISFTATAGTFIATASKTIKQLTDSLGSDGRYARVMYVADTTMKLVYITAETTNARARKILTIKK